MFDIINNEYLNEDEKCKEIEAAFTKDPEVLNGSWLGMTPLQQCFQEQFYT